MKRDPVIAAWIQENSDELGKIARRWRELMGCCRDDLRELLHDGYPTGWVVKAFTYVSAFVTQVNGGFFCAAEISELQGLKKMHPQIYAPCETQTRTGYRCRSSHEAGRNCLH